VPPHGSEGERESVGSREREREREREMGGFTRYHSP
jgi:hypothetical protein